MSGGLQRVMTAAFNQRTATGEIGNAIETALIRPWYATDTGAGGRRYARGSDALSLPDAQD